MEVRDHLQELRAVLDGMGGRYRELRGADDVGAYLAASGEGEDEETLTEPLLADLLERVLGFPRDAYFPQRGRGGRKPDFTPTDLLAHSFVLDAKSSSQPLDRHEGQVRDYMEQRRLILGVLFNLRELRVYRRGTKGHDPELSFGVPALWRYARGETAPPPELERFERFLRACSHRSLTADEKVRRIRRAPRWEELEAAGEVAELDIDFLVDRLRTLSRLLAEDAGTRAVDLFGELAINPARAERFVQELRYLALDIEPGTALGKLPETGEDFATAAAASLAGRVWRQYLLRVSQLALTRIVLYRAWEDVGFVDQHLYDGGFGTIYDRLGERVRDVLDEAFMRGAQRYRWLYGAENDYDWYRPSEDVLVEVLYSLIPVPLGRLDADVLGGLYESYVDEIDRDRLGQFYTPRDVVRFMLDRSGFRGATGAFHLEGDRRRRREVLDFSTGSGGFLVEAARRIADATGSSTTDARDHREALDAIANGLHGGEISPFAYYLTEVNLLLQASRVLGRLRDADMRLPSFVLSVVGADTLAARGGTAESLEGFDPGLRADQGELVEEATALVPLDAEKRAAFARMRQDGTFDLVVGNPPYVAEAGNRILFSRLRRMAAWKDTYRGKGDYLYYFLLLAAEKVRPGGRLAVITPAGWMNAGAADWLRLALADQLRLDELFLLGSFRLFAPDRSARRERRHAPTPTVESAILIATKEQAPDDHELRIVALEDEPEAARALGAGATPRTPDRRRLLTAMAERIDGESGRSDGLLVHRVAQGELPATGPWPIKHEAGGLSMQVATHLDAALDGPASRVEPLARRWVAASGIETGADAYTRKIEKRLDEKDRAALTELGVQIGTPIMELPAGREREPPWDAHPEVLARSPEPEAIIYGALDADDFVSLVWLRGEDEPSDEVVGALAPWRPVLAGRAEIVRNPRRRWWETAWPRDRAAMRAPKVIALHRTDRGRFAMDEAGEWQANKKATIITARHEPLSVAYLCGLLNTELLDIWYGVRGRAPRDVWRDYEPSPLSRIPYRHVPSVAAMDSTANLAVLKQALPSQDAAAAAAACAAIDVTHRPDEAAAAVEALVRAVAANRRELLALRTWHRPWRAP